MHDIMESLMQVVPMLKDILMEDIAVCITDTEQFIYYRQGDTIDLKNYPGKELVKEDPLYKVMQSGEAAFVIVPKELYDVPFKGVSTPIKDDSGHVIGSVGIARSLDKQSKVEQAAADVFTSLQEVQTTIKQLTENSHEISAAMNKIVVSSEKTEKHINETDKLIKSIKNISVQSNILALNAAVEAARAGTAGKGFAVVSEEMRRLSQTSKDSANKISDLLFKMKEAIDEILNEINTTTSISEKQMTDAEQATVFLDKITSSSQDMLELSKLT